MNIGIFWLGELDPDIPEFCSNLFNPHPLISLTLFSNHKSNICNALAREENSYNFDEINALCDVFKNINRCGHGKTLVHPKRGVACCILG